MKPLRVMTILGTRPEIIRLSRVMARLDEACEQIIVHTGQNFDYELNEVFFSDLGVRKPDRFLGTGGGTLGQTLGKILSQAEVVLREYQPDAVLILGDTNSAITAIIARRMKIPVYHMEAGNRSFDRNVPEETNRKIVDHIADFNLVYTEHARRHLIAEGLQQRRIYHTGSPMREVLDYYRPQIEQSHILGELGLETGRYVVASLHREENVDNSQRLRSLLNGLEQIAREHDCPVVISTHPRTRNRLAGLGEKVWDERLRFLKPFGFHDYNKLQLNALCAISDSGTIAEEASILGFPAVTPRDAIERPEALDVGCIVMTGVEEASLVTGVQTAIRMAADRRSTGAPMPVPVDYCVDNTAERVVSLIIGTAQLSNSWDGIRRNDLT